MLGPERFLADGERSLIERLGLLISPLRIVECCQIVEALSRIGMFGPEPFFADGKSPLKERLGFGILSSLGKVPSRSIHHSGGLWKLEAILINTRCEHLRMRNQATTRWPVGIFGRGEDFAHRANSP